MKQKISHSIATLLITCDIIYDYKLINNNKIDNLVISLFLIVKLKENSTFFFDG